MVWACAEREEEGLLCDVHIDHTGCNLGAEDPPIRPRALFNNDHYDVSSMISFAQCPIQGFLVLITKNPCDAFGTIH